MHGGHLAGGPRGNQHAVKHGRYSALAIAQRRQARKERRRLQGLALLARYGFSSFEEVFAVLEARIKARREG